MSDPAADSLISLESGQALKCHDCRSCAEPYLVRNSVWRQAFPEYGEVKRTFRETAPEPIGCPRCRKIEKWVAERVWLCASCLEQRLGRDLRPSDFDLSVPMNSCVALGLRMARAGG